MILQHFSVRNFLRHVNYGIFSIKTFPGYGYSLTISLEFFLFREEKKCHEILLLNEFFC